MSESADRPGEAREARETLPTSAGARGDGQGDAAARSRGPLPLELSEVVGPYRLLSVLGTGGFGVVYLAERREPYVQRVALKVLLSQPGMDSEEIIARFEQERQALALMDHPCVAKVLDAGTAQRGHPYFVMELVQGEPITDYCDRRKLTIHDRLELFVSVCAAVQHAHNKGVIHRDIKPSNVLVTEAGGKPTPKVIDFGVAKATSRALTAKTIFTEVGRLIGTPEYMSPEQADLTAVDIDTRTDVYSLGVMLYELLTGALPFDSRSLRAAGYAEIQRIIREVDPPKPSTRLTALGETAAAIAGRRQLDIEGLERELRRELDWIPLKAMRKDREQRYRTPTELADDILNYLSGRPLLAGPESFAYRGRKFLRRNRATAVSAGVLAVVLIGATVVSTIFGVREAAARRETAAALEEANRQRDIAGTVNSFLNDDLLSPADPDRDRPDITVRELLDRAADSIPARFAGSPGVERGIRSTLGSTYLGIGLPDKARPQLERARLLFEQAAPGELDQHDSLELKIGEALYRMGRAGEAIPMLEQVVRGLEARKGPLHEHTLSAQNQLAGAYKWADREDEARALYAKVIAGRTATLGPLHRDTLISRKNLALISLRRANAALIADRPKGTPVMEGALQEMRGIAADFESSAGRLDAETLAAQSELALMLRRLERFEEARSAYAALLPVMREKLGRPHWRTLDTEVNAARLDMVTGHPTLAADHLVSVLPLVRDTRGPTHETTVLCALWITECREKDGRGGEALPVLERAFVDLMKVPERAGRGREVAKVAAELCERLGKDADAAVWRERSKP